MTKEEMKEKIIEAKKAYYNSDTPIMTDKEFDDLWSSFVFLYPEDPLCSLIGAPVEETKEWKKMKHTIPMCSLNKVNTFEEFTKWCEKVSK